MCARRWSGFKLSVVAHAGALSAREARQDDRHKTEASLGYVAKFRSVRLLANFCQNKKTAWRGHALILALEKFREALSSRLSSTAY